MYLSLNQINSSNAIDGIYTVYIRSFLNENPEKFRAMKHKNDTIFVIPDEEFAKAITVRSRSVMYDALIEMPVDNYQEMVVEFGFGYFQNSQFCSEISVFDLACFLIEQNYDPLEISKGNWR